MYHYSEIQTSKMHSVLLGTLGKKNKKQKTFSVAFVSVTEAKSMQNKWKFT